MSMRPRSGSRKRGIFIGAVILILLVLAASSRFYTDLLWFKEVGFSSVLWKSLRTQFLLGAGVGIITAAIVWVNLKLAERMAPTYRSGTYVVGGRPDPMDQYRTALTPYTHWIRLGVSLLVGLLAGLGASASW